MHYYRRFPGDYGRDTAHLSLAEHGAYTLLLDAYYATGRPLPAEYEALCRICRARGAAEVKAVRKVADEFFPLSDDGVRRNKRAERQIPEEQKRIDAARRNGTQGGRRKEPAGLAKQEPTGLPKPEPNENPLGYQSEAQQDTQPGTDWANSPSPSLYGKPSVYLRGVETCAQAREEGQEPPAGDGLALNVRLSIAAREQGVECHSHDPRLLVLAEQGVTVETLVAACVEARKAYPDDRIGIGLVATILARWAKRAASLEARGAKPPASKQAELERRNAAVAASWVPPELGEVGHAG